MSSPSPRSVLVISSNTVGGGAERFATDFVQLLLSKGDRPQLATLFPAQPTDGGFAVTSLGHRDLFSSWRTVRRLGALIDEHRFDVVLSNGRYTGQFAAAALRKRPGRWICRIGSPLDNARRGFREHLGRRYFRHVARRADAFVCNSDGLSADLCRALPDARPRTIPNCISDRLRSNGCPVAQPGAESRERLTVLWAGRFVPGKAPLKAIEALERVAKTLPLRAVFCGSGPLRDEIAGRAGLVKNLELEVLPWQDDLPTLMQRCDLFFFTSRWEGMPNVLVEAGACGLPSVATNCDFGPSEIVTSDTGCLVEVDDVEAMADSMKRLLSDRERLRTMGRNARNRILTRHSADAIWPQWDAVLRPTSSEADNIVRVGASVP